MNNPPCVSFPCLALALGVLWNGLPGAAAQEDTCRWAHDSECDEPEIGTGLCQPRTDATDCAYPPGRGPEPPPGSIPYDRCHGHTMNGVCDHPDFGTGACAMLTDATDCGMIPGPGPEGGGPPYALLFYPFDCTISPCAVWQAFEVPGCSRLIADEVDVTFLTDADHEQDALTAQLLQDITLVRGYIVDQGHPTGGYFVFRVTAVRGPASRSAVEGCKSFDRSWQRDGG